ncbi:MAG: MFS transporter [Terrimicrobiaceae bacterium]
MSELSSNPFQRNIPLFIAFRVLFNARFYYPVLGVLFLDLGLTLEQYSILNAAWAATIIVFEIPSGALADVIGRRRMVMAAAGLMVVEIAIFAFAPAGPLLFWFLLLNRVVSGVAEACASGADEALAYDSLPPGNRETEWPTVLARLVRWSSASFFIAMILGAAVFDAGVVNSACAMLGLPGGWSSAETVRWPIYLTLATAVLAACCAAGMREPTAHRSGNRYRIQDALGNIAKAAQFVFSSRRILLLLLAGVLFDSTIRLFLTFASNYYRLIELPAFANGLLGSVFAVLGFLAASLARRLATKVAPVTVACLLAGILLSGLIGLCAATPVWGAWVLIPLGLVMPMTQFFLSNYLNAWTSSDLRATVLSFRGMALNVGYGLAGIGFAFWTASLRARSPGLDSDVLFGQTINILPIAFVCGSLALALYAWLTRPSRG